MNHLFTASIFVAIAMALSVPSPAVAQNFPPSVTQKIHAAQKQVKANATAQKKQQASAAKQVVGKK